VARPRTPVDTFGDITFETAPGGRVRALARFRDEDGRLHRVVATAGSERGAERLLKTRMSRRTYQDGHGELSPDSSFGQLVELWLEDLDLEGRLAPNTRTLYERNMRPAGAACLRALPAAGDHGQQNQDATAEELQHRQAAKVTQGAVHIVADERRCPTVPYAGWSSTPPRSGARGPRT